MVPVQGYSIRLSELKLSVSHRRWDGLGRFYIDLKLDPDGAEITVRSAELAASLLAVRNQCLLSRVEAAALNEIIRSWQFMDRAYRSDLEQHRGCLSCIRQLSSDFNGIAVTTLRGIACPRDSEHIPASSSLGADNEEVSSLDDEYEATTPLPSPQDAPSPNSSSAMDELSLDEL